MTSAPPRHVATGDHGATFVDLFFDLVFVYSVTQVVGLLVAYSLGLGIPFIAVALAVDRAPLITRPLLRYSRVIEVAGGLLIIILGLALIFDWLDVIARQFAWLDFSTWIEIPI